MSNVARQKSSRLLDFVNLQRSETSCNEAQRCDTKMAKRNIGQVLYNLGEIKGEINTNDILKYISMSSMIQIKKVCEYCGKEFIAHKTVTRFCSHQCAQRNYKKQKREEKIEKVLEEQKHSNTNQPTINSREYLSCEDVADLMGISRTTVYRYCITGKMNCIRMNRKIFIRKSDIDLLFTDNEPYEVRPVEKRELTEFYTMKEITEKYKVSSSKVYNLVNAKRIPKILRGGATVYSKIHIDKHLSLYAGDPDIESWYSTDEIQEKYDMTLQSIYSMASDNVIPRKKENGRTYYSASHVDAIMAQRLPDITITEWYTMDDIKRIYGLEQRYVSGLIYKNPIPKIRRGNKGYYSKVHFDQLMAEKFPKPEYYTVEEAMDKYKVSRDSLYHFLRRNNIETIKEGRIIKIPKDKIDKVFENIIIS